MYLDIIIIELYNTIILSNGRGWSNIKDFQLRSSYQKALTQGI